MLNIHSLGVAGRASIFSQTPHFIRRCCIHLWKGGLCFVYSWEGTGWSVIVNSTSGTNLNVDGNFIQTCRVGGRTNCNCMLLKKLKFQRKSFPKPRFLFPRMPSLQTQKWSFKCLEIYICISKLHFWRPCKSERESKEGKNNSRYRVWLEYAITIFFLFSF